MPIMEYLLPCRFVSIDARTNTISLFSLLDQVDLFDPRSVPGAGLPHLALEIVAGWRKSTGEPDAALMQRTMIVSPAGTESEIDVTVFQMGEARQRVLTSVPRVAVETEGTYRIRAYIADAAEPFAGWGEPRGEYTFDVRFAERLIRVRLNARERDLLSKDVRGQGGYQSLLRRLQNAIYDSDLVLTTADAERLIRSAASYGEGGFQNRLRPIVEKVRRELSRVIDAELVTVGGQ